MARRKYHKPRYRKTAAKDEASKARSIQAAYRKATDRTDTLPMTDARKIVDNPPSCPYCKKPIPYREISIDHVQPRSKGGASTKDNLVYCCRSCNLTKSDMSAEEYTALLEFLKAYPGMQESILTRLRAGGARIYGRKRRYR